MPLPTETVNAVLNQLGENEAIARNYNDLLVYGQSALRVEDDGRCGVRVTQLPPEEVPPGLAAYEAEVPRRGTVFVRNPRCHTTVEIRDRPNRTTLEVEVIMPAQRTTYLLERYLPGQRPSYSEQYDVDCRRAAQHEASQMAERVYRETFDEITRAFARVQEPDRPRDAPSFFGHSLDALRHAVDLGVGMVERREKPTVPTAFEKLKGMQGVIVKGDFTATLLADDMSVWHEAQRMGHCLFRAYTHKMEAGTYVAYHVSCRRLTKNGFTLGFARNKRDNRPGPGGNPGGEAWRYDQNKGKANSTNSDTALAEFCAYVGRVINGTDTNGAAPGPTPSTNGA